jgi:hypothetical protein
MKNQWWWEGGIWVGEVAGTEGGVEKGIRG